MDQLIQIQNVKVDMKSAEPMWLQLANQLEQAVLQDGYKIGYTLPPMAMIRRTASVSQATVYRAYRHLLKKGLVQWVKFEGFLVTR